jgi:hypothetical protein
MLIRNQNDIRKVIQNVSQCIGKARILNTLEKRISEDGKIPIVDYIQVPISYKNHLITISAQRINNSSNFTNTIISEIDGNYNEVVKILIGPTFVNNPNITGNFSCTEKILTKILNYL